MKETSEKKETQKKKGCFHRLLNGCAILLLSFALGIVVSILIVLFFVTRVYDAESPKAQQLSLEIYGAEITNKFELVGAADWNLMRVVIYKKESATDPQVLMLVDTKVAGLNASIINQIFELICGDYLQRTGMITEVKMRDKSVGLFRCEYEVEKFNNIVYTPKNEFGIEWHQAVIKKGSRTLYLCLITSTSQSEEGQKLFNQSILEEKPVEKLIEVLVN